MLRNKGRIGVAHDARWPDKSMFAALLLIVAGILGAAFGFLKPAVSFGSCPDASCTPVPDFLRDYPWFIEAPLSLAAAALGFASLRLHRTRYAIAGAICAVASLGLMGLEAVMGAIAGVLLALGHREGEQHFRGGRRLEASQWPDKAISASLFLFVAGLMSVATAILLLTDRLNPWLMPMPIEGGTALVAGLVALGASYESYHLRRAWLGFLACVLLVATLALYGLIPLLALVAAWFLRQAGREHEFAAPAATRTA